MHLPHTVRNDWTQLCDNFVVQDNGNHGVASEASILNIKQLSDESCASYFTQFTRVTANRNYHETIPTGVVVNGLLPKTKSIILPQDLKTIEAVRKSACYAERTVNKTSSVPNTVAAVSEVGRISFLTKQLEQVMAQNSGFEDLKRQEHSTGPSFKPLSYRSGTGPAYQNQYPQQ